jgi:hypothetical protein
MSYNDAITMIQRRRPQAQPIPEFVTMLQQFEITCRRPETDVSGGKTGHISTGSNDTTSFESLEVNGVDDVKGSITSIVKNDKRKINTSTSTVEIGPQRPPPPPTNASDSNNETFTTTSIKRQRIQPVVGPQQRAPPTDDTL